MNSLMNELLQNLSTEPLDTLELMVRKLAAETLADGCFIITEENEAFHIVASSGGEMTLSPHAFEYAKINKCGDKALYICKENGRNRCEIYDNSYEILAKSTNTAKGILYLSAFARKRTYNHEDIDLARYLCNLALTII